MMLIRSHFRSHLKWIFPFIIAMLLFIAYLNQNFGVLARKAEGIAIPPLDYTDEQYIYPNVSVRVRCPVPNTEGFSGTVTFLPCLGLGDRVNGAIFAFMLAQATKRHFIMEWPEVKPYFESSYSIDIPPSGEIIHLKSRNSIMKYRPWMSFQPKQNTSYTFLTNTPYQNALFENPILAPQLEAQGWNTIERRDLPACVMHQLFRPTALLLNMVQEPLTVIKQARDNNMLIIAIHVMNGGKASSAFAGRHLIWTL